MSEKVVAYGRGLLKDFTKGNLETLVGMPKFMKKLFAADIDGENFFYKAVATDEKMRVWIATLTDNITKQKAVSECLGEETLQYRNADGAGCVLMMLREYHGASLLYFLVLRNNELRQALFTNKSLSEIIPAPTGFGGKRTSYPISLAIQLIYDSKGRELLLHALEKDESLKVPLKILLTYYPYRVDSEARTALHSMAAGKDFKLMNLIYMRDPLLAMCTNAKVLGYLSKPPPKAERTGLPSHFSETSVFYLLTKHPEGCEFIRTVLLPCEGNKLLTTDGSGLTAELIVGPIHQHHVGTAPKSSEFPICNMTATPEGQALIAAIYEKLPGMQMQIAEYVKSLASEQAQIDFEKTQEGKAILDIVKTL
eukprot:TRINITY_DN24002_c0_g1_i1.p1 TRINITY_DN24002_c0_g1~~TRINITY_DN24002_c0_g1_i1.p1  ORF type:complete len:378 (+),score=69.62 TRINITY_DN24002_c0_g1_i1:36-1136(+)